MPWCETCSRFYNPPSLSKDGQCPTCGRVIAQPVRAAWHFKLLLAAATVYLGWRAVQGIDWVVRHIA